MRKLLPNYRTKLVRRESQIGIFRAGDYTKTKPSTGYKSKHIILQTKLKQISNLKLFGFELLINYVGYDVNNRTFTYLFMSLADRFFAFFNGMVAGTSTLTQDGRRSLSCNPSRSLKSDSKLNLKMQRSIMVSWTA